MEKYFDRNEVRVTFTFNDGTKLLENIRIDHKDPDFFPKPAIDDPKFKAEISGWLEALQQTVLGFFRQAPREIERKVVPQREMGPGAFDAKSEPEIVPQGAHERHVGFGADVVSAICPHCNVQIPLRKGCCGGGGEQIYKGKCPQCGRPVTLPSRAVRR